MRTDACRVARRRLRTALLSPLLLFFAGPTLAGEQETGATERERGARLFRTHCASCHGAEGKGDGAMADQLRFAPADLTQIARHNGGKFPSEKVYRMIDGRTPTKGHGDSDMPVWGDAFKSSAEAYDEATVREKITALVRHLESLQEKSPPAPR